MTTQPSLRPVVIAARSRLTAGRTRAKELHLAGGSGAVVCATLADLIDQVVGDLWEQALDDLAARPLLSSAALVALGGYGRRDVAPYSDVDLLLLHSPASTATIEPLARRIVQDVCDAGLELGFSARTPAGALQAARDDAATFTALVEARYLAGSVSLLADFLRNFQYEAQRGSKKYIAMIERARAEERAQYGETAYLLRPNVKRSPGCLRGLQFIRWIGMARYGVVETEELCRLGALPVEDPPALAAASDYLLRLRNELHFHADKSADVLDRAEQVRLAERAGLQGDDGLLPVERFMREFFQITRQVRYVASNFVASARPSPRLARVLGPVFSRQVERDYRLGPVHISAQASGLEKLQTDLGETLRLVDLAAHHNRRIAHSTWTAVRQAAPRLPDAMTGEIRERFLSLLSQTKRLGSMLRRLHELGVLEKIIPAMSHARCLLQFNAYHKYTVDEHSILAVECAARMGERTDRLGEAYREIKDKWLLHLALLLHDLGKGFVEDHSEKGRKIALETAARLKLSDDESETLAFLVHKHLLLNHTALRRDLDDDETVVRLAIEIGSPQRLRMLFVHSAADLEAVGPNVLNDWKLDLLTLLYDRTMRQLADDSSASHLAEAVERRREQVRQIAAVAGMEGRRDWLTRQIDQAPSGYLLGSPPEVVAEELTRLAMLKPKGAEAWARYVPGRKTVEYKIASFDDVAPGVFHRLTGALAGKNLQILAAQINTLADGVILDRFLVHDGDFADAPPPERLEQICQSLVQSLVDGDRKQGPKFRRVWQAEAHRNEQSLIPSPSRVVVDTASSDAFTLIEVFARDRVGLLYAIARTLFELGLSVAVAKVSTHVDQAVDVFYVTDASGQKIDDPRRIQLIRAALLEAIEEKTD